MALPCPTALQQLLITAELNVVKGKKKRKWTCIAPIVSMSTIKRSDVDHTELPANKPHLPFPHISIR